MTDIALFSDLIKRRCGLSFEADKRPLLEGALQERMRATGFTVTAAYFNQVVAIEREFADLVSLLTINETYFYREPQHLNLVTERLIPRLLAKPGRALPLRILSAACSTGEEPYSIMMAVRERHGDGVARLLNIVGTDIDRRALVIARKALYKEFSFRGVAQSLKERYFLFDGTNYALLPAGREGVEFMPMNLLDDPDDAKLGTFDIIFLRNVTIYFDEPTRRDIQRRLSRLLREDGYLVVGMAETLANDFGLLSLVQEDGVFYFAQTTAALADPVPVPKPPPLPTLSSAPVLAPDLIPVLTTSALPKPLPASLLAPMPASTPASAPATTPPAPATTALPAASAFDQASRLTWERSYDQALPLLQTLTAEVKNPAVDSRPWLLKAHILLNRKDFSAAEAEANRVLEAEPWSIDAFLVLGLSARYAEKADQSLSWFKRAVYATHSCWPAHFHLADLHRLAGDQEQARNAYRVALRLLKSEPTPDTGIKVLLPAFPVSDMRFLCEHQLCRMEGRAPPERRQKPRT